MPAKLDLYKKFAADYVTPRQPVLVRTHAAQYLAIAGRGEPGGPEFTARLGCLYNVAFTIKMARKFAGRDYAVSKLEGLWWGRRKAGSAFMLEPRERWRWELIIRTPDFIAERELLGAVAGLLERDKPAEVRDVCLRPLSEGECVQLLHVGPYADEPASVERMEAFAREQGRTVDGVHHEIYLSDPRRVAAARLRTILRLPVSLGVVCGMLMCASVATAQSSAADSVARLDSAWARSYAVHDTAVAQALFASDLVVVGGNGSLKNRDAEMRDIRPQAGLRMHYFRTRDVDVRCYAGACAVVGIAEWEFEFNGRVDATRRRYSATWIRGGPLGWQMVTLHISQALAP